jgi:hypothetical protein
VGGFYQFLRAALERVVLPGLQLGDACGVDVEADDGALLAEFNG